MAQARGLGKGLDALFQINEENENQGDRGKADTAVDISLIDPNREQPRSEFDEIKLKELCDSIKQHGVLQPIVIRPVGQRYSIVAGERRWRASKMAGLKEIPAVIRDISEQEAMEIALIENLQRENLNVIEEAVGIQRLIREFGLTQEQASERLGKSRSAVANTLRLLALPEKVKDLVMRDKMSAGHARALLGLRTEEDINAAAQTVLGEVLSVRDTERLVKEFYNAKKKVEPKEKSIYLIEIEDKLKQHLGTKVAIVEKENKSVIQIESYGDEDLNRILDLIMTCST